MLEKEHFTSLAIFAGDTLFESIKSTSNLVKPSTDKFFEYSNMSLDANWLSNNGPCVKLLEERLAKIHDVKYCICVCNGLWGIILALKCLAIEGKKEIIMPSLTYRRMADIAAWLNLVPRFCEVSEKTLGVTKKTISQRITSDTAIILAPHPIVNLCDIEGICDLSSETGIPVLFDSVEAAYATHNGRSIGSFGDVECFSLHASKFLNGFEGGYLTTNNENLAHQLKNLRGFGFVTQDQTSGMGLNLKLNEIHAAMTLASIDDIENQITRNKERYEEYTKGLEGTGLILVPYSTKDTRTYKNILVYLSDEWPFTREDTLKILHSENILARPYYSPALHQKETTYDTIIENLDQTEKLTEKYLLLPSGHFLTINDVKKICDFLSFIHCNSEEILPQLSEM